MNNKNKIHLDFKIKEYMVDKDTLNRLQSDYESMRILTTSSFTITVDNSKADSHNINIDYPTFHCFAVNEAEAVGLMMFSDFQHKHLKIDSIISI